MACWVRKDMVPTVARQMVREYIYAYSALSAQTGELFSMISPYCNTEAMNEFIRQLARQYHEYRIVMLLDKAGWHISGTLVLPDNVKFVHLTPYSPELNPVEILWREVRAKYFHNRFFETLDEVEQNLSEALLFYHQNKTIVKNLSEGFSYFNKIDGG